MIFASINPAPALSESLSLFWIALIASVGALVVLIGVAMEVSAEKPWYKNISSRRFWEEIKTWGGRLVVAGLCWEVVFGTGLAIKEEIDARHNREHEAQIAAVVINLPSKILQAQEEKYNGALIPANDPSPKLPNGENPPTNFITFFFGNSASVVAWFPHTVILYKGTPSLTVSTNSLGATVSANIFDVDGKIVATLENNDFHINPLNSFRIERPDASTLKIRNQQNEIVLDVRFLNPKAIKLNGHLRFPDGGDVIISEKTGLASTRFLSRFCVVDFNFR